MTFLPGGNILVSERGGKLRILRDNVLDPQPIGGFPKSTPAPTRAYTTLSFSEVRSESVDLFRVLQARGSNQSATVLARAKLQGNSLQQVQELYSTEQGTNVGGSRLAFAPDGTI